MIRLKKLLDYLHKKPELVFVLIALPFGLFSAFFVPQISVTDENSHLLRIYQISQGEFICKNKTTYPTDIVNKSATGNNGSRDYTKDFTDNIYDSGDRKYGCGSAAGYSPLAYAPQSIGAIISQLIHPTTASFVLFARIASLLFYVSAVYFIIRKVRVGKYVFFVVALIPQMIHLAASLSADMMNNVATLAIVALTLNLFTQKTKINKRQMLALFGLVVGSVLLKRNLILLFLPMLFLPARLFKDSDSKIPFNVHKWTLALCVMIFAASIYLLWAHLSYVETNFVAGALNPVAERPILFLNLLFNTYLSDYGDLVLRGVFGEFSSFLYHFPTILVFLQMITLLAVLLYRPAGSKVDTVINNKWLIISSFVSVVLSILAITYGLYTEWGLKRGIVEYADGVQGRYFTSLIVLLIPLFAWISRYVSIKAKSDKTIFFIVVVNQIVLLSFYVLYTVKMLLGK